MGEKSGSRGRESEGSERWEVMAMEEREVKGAEGK